MQPTCRRVEKIYSTGFAFAVVFDAEAVPVPEGVPVPVDGGISVSDPVPVPVWGAVPVQGGIPMAGGDVAVPIPGGSDVPLTVPGVVVPVPEPAKLTLKDGKVVTWGDQSWGGDSRSEAALRGVDKIYSTERAFAAVVKDGTMVTWGD